MTVNVTRLRKKLADNAHSGISKRPVTVMAALIIKAWNFYEQGEKPKLLKFTAGGASPEAFPQVYNPYKDSE